MKNIKWVIFLIIVLVCVYFYSVTDITEALYDTETSTNDYANTGVIYDGSLEQKIVVNEDVLDGVSVKCGLSGDYSQSVVQYQLLDENGRVAGEGETAAVDIKDKKLFQFSFPQIQGCRGKEYTFRIEETGASEENGVNFYVDPSVQDKSVVVRGENIQGSLVAKTVSHRFDLKTYVIVLCFVAYVVGFFKVLGKLFR